MRKLFLILCVCLLSSLWLMGAASMVLKNTAVVSDSIVRMKDIAVMDTETRTKIGNLVVAVAPEVGSRASIQKQEIYEKLIGNGVASPKINGPAVVKIERKGTSVEPSFFKDKILEYIVGNSKWKDGVQVQIVSNKKIIVPTTGVRWQLMPANGQDFFGNVLFKVQAFSLSNNEEIYSNWIVAKLRITKDVAISNRTIQKNEIIGEGDIRWERREITAFTKDALYNKNEVIGQRSGRVIRSNSVITSGLLAKKFLVKRGSNATLVASFNSVKATSTVRVLSDGSAGDTVRVMNTRSKKILYATVTGRNTLEVTVQ